MQEAMMFIPFNGNKLKQLMTDARVDLLLAITRHNVRYLTGGYHYHFHANSSRMGLSRYIPVVGIPAQRVEDAFYIHRKEELDQMTPEFPWIVNRVEAIRGTDTTAERLIETIRARGLAHNRIAVEMPFLPADVYMALRSGFPEAEILDGTAILEELRMIKSETEIRHLHSVYDRVAQSIQDAFAQSGAGDTTAEIEDRVRLAMARRGVNFLFALIATGPSFVRPPSPTITWNHGRLLHIDAGGEEGDYIGDVCRMGYLGEPSSLAKRLHAACLEVQNITRAAIRPGVPVNRILATGKDAVSRYPFSEYSRFVVHSIGVVPYEQPRVTPENDRPLEEGMVLSVETDYIHPEEGHLKIEDSVVVTANGCDGMGDIGREWHIR